MGSVDGLRPPAGAAPLHPIALHAPAGAGLALLLVLTADSFFTVRLLRRTHNVDLLGLPNLLASLR